MGALIMPVAGEVAGITRTSGAYTCGVVDRVANGYVRMSFPTRYIPLADIVEVERCAPGCPDCPPGAPSAA